ncbi:hypothetical protein H310_11430 [Aphanomyces invadans]|uniref:Diphthamide biosynthesis protein 3 n=1 Tax=Aphanomyces invadans TaxID=157072 RepID=A0A024TNF4_9STRA|nr:hypothetical protein H310_11430 [Aphanomyces invadans]ETV95166.1 hypothetical protein H310_11430 [Aphanomyces invadans]|eukprot:XP_008876339.1 hypothetical protein H310_11430 [Aphanomyces invadans]
MSTYDEIEIEDMEYDEKEQIYTYPCPCGDNFFITLQDLYDGDDIGTCPSCSLTIRVIFDEDNLPELRDEEDDDCAVDDLVEHAQEKLTVAAVSP